MASSSSATRFHVWMYKRTWHVETLEKRNFMAVGGCQQRRGEASDSDTDNGDIQTHDGDHRDRRRKGKRRRGWGLRAALPGVSVRSDRSAGSAA